MSGHSFGLEAEGIREVLNYREDNNVGYYAAFEVNRLSPHRW